MTVSQARDTVRPAAAVAVPRLLRAHWPFAVLLLLGAVLRGVVLAAYQPALIFPDSVRYLQFAHNFAHGHWTVDGERQSGYSILFLPAVAAHALIAIPLIQHLAGLAAAVLIYALLVRCGARTWLAALATIPVLFDPLALILEEYVLADVWTMLLLLVALAVLAWPGTEPGWRRAAAAGLAIGVSVTFRDQYLIMIVPAALYLVLTASRRYRLRLLAVLLGAFLLPVAGYLGWFYGSHGKVSFTTFSGAFLYGRVADFADCGTLKTLPDYERPLCPTQPARDRVADYYTWNPASPLWTFAPPEGRSRQGVARDFSVRILEHQPLDYTTAVMKDLAYGFSPVRGAGPEHYPSDYLRFHTTIKPDTQADASLRAIGFGPPRSRPGLAGFLHGYWFYVPGPLLAAGLLAGVAGWAWGRNQRTLLFTLSAVLVLIPPALFATFDWRYQLPQLVLIPIAAVLATRTNPGHQANWPFRPEAD